MYFQKRHGRYSFVYYDSELRKNIRLTQQEIPLIQSDEEAQRFCDDWEKKYESSSIRTEKKLEWMLNYPDFIDFLRIYERHQKEEAPNSWQDCVNNVQLHVLSYFLTEKKLADMNQWRLHFEDFRRHLETTEPVKKQRDSNMLAYATINRIITTLNTFMHAMYLKNLVTQPHKCRLFSDDKLNRKDATSVIPENIQNQIYQALLLHHTDAAEFFWVALKTGLRVNEQSGLSLSDFFPDASEIGGVFKTLDQYNLKPLGFICIESQPAHRSGQRDEKGHILRKPLKGKRRGGIENARFIPIFDEDCYSILDRRWNRQKMIFNRGIYGKESSNYLLFDELTPGKYATILAKVERMLDLSKPFSPHDCRHTYSTWLADVTGGNYALCQSILGHSELSTTLRYVHINGGMKLKLRQSQRLRETTRLSKVSNQLLASNIVPFRRKDSNG